MSPDLTVLDALRDRLRAPAGDGEPALDPGDARLAIVIGTEGPDTWNACVAVARYWLDRRPTAALVGALPAGAWPFTYPIDVASGPALVVVPDAHEMCRNHQNGGTRLVTTQASYLFQAWLDANERDDVLLLAMGQRTQFEEHAPEVLTRRGPFANAFVLVVDTPALPAAEMSAAATAPDEARGLLQEAIRSRESEARLRLCVEALSHGRTPAALVATASACVEVNDFGAAGRDLDEAIAAAPEWAAAHFERGKVWLRVDDMERASASFAQAAERMPRFGPAWANLGATLGELDRPEQALAAFERALACDPDSAQAHNNIGVVQRELAQLADAEAAFRRAIQLAPDLAFGYYNLGHTLFLQGRYHAALGAYAEGRSRDREGNPVQVSRLAMCRLATGDPAGALSDLQAATSALPRDYRQQLLADTHAIAWALLTHRPDLAGWSQVHEWLTRELAPRA
jgi:tetratricopeptide (TPR) repeat protein